MARTSAKAKKSKQEVNKKKEEVKKPKENSSDSEGSGEPTDKENDSTNFDVEKIAHTRIYKGKRQYLVRWKGYTEDNDTWENESALQSCQDILEAFKKEHLSEENPDDELEEEEVKETRGKKSKKVAKNTKKNTKKSGKAKTKPVEEEDSNNELEEEEIKGTRENKHKKVSVVNNLKEDSTISDKAKTNEDNSSEMTTGSDQEEEGVKGTGKKGKTPKKIPDDNVEKNKQTNVNKRKSVKEKDAPDSKKAKQDDSDDESVTDGKDYEVDKIIEVHTRKDGSREFLIRWKGYRPSEDTWEPEAHLDCQDLIKKFMEKVDKAKGCTRKELRTRVEAKRFVPLSTRRVGNQRNSGLRPCYTESCYEG